MRRLRAEGWPTLLCLASLVFDLRLLRRRSFSLGALRICLRAWWWDSNPPLLISLIVFELLGPLAKLPQRLATAIENLHLLDATERRLWPL